MIAVGDSECVLLRSDLEVEQLYDVSTVAYRPTFA